MSRFFILVSALVLLSSCTPDEETEFFTRVSALCGNTYEGRLVSDDEVDAEFGAERIVMHVRDCSNKEIRIPLHVGENRSRTWIITKTPGRLTLKHDHRHEDGEADAVTMYGGDNAPFTSGSRATFPADDYSKAMFEAEGIEVSAENTWAIEVRPDAKLFAYEMSRPNRFFRLEFDTSEPVDPPPAAWGSE